MSTYYVRTDGHDTASGANNTADPATGAWLTLQKAHDTAAAGDTVLVVAGTYQEAAYLSITRALASDVLIASLSGVATDVVLQGTTANTIFASGAAHWAFQQVTFAQQSAAHVSACRLSGCADITFTDCRFVASGNQAIYMQATAGQVVERITLTRPIVVATGTAHGIRIYGDAAAPVRDITITAPTVTAGGIGLYIAVGTGTVEGVAVTGAGTITSTGVAAIQATAIDDLTISDIDGQGLTRGLYVYSATNIAINRGEFSGNTGHGALIGRDLDTDGPMTAVLTDVRCRSAETHGLLLGASATDIDVNGGDFAGSDWGVVVRSLGGAVMDGICAAGGDSGCMQFYGAHTSSLLNSVLMAPAGVAIQVVQDGAAVACHDLTITGNQIIMGGAADAYDWGDAADDSGGSVVNSNVYHLYGTGDYGSVVDTAGITTIAGLRAAWADYDVITNDALSTAIGDPTAGSSTGSGSATGVVTPTTPTTPAGDDITITTAVTWEHTFYGLGSLVGRTGFYLGVQRRPGDPDADAMLLIEETDGLLRLYGAAPSSALLGSLTVDDEVTGTATARLEASGNASLPEAYGLRYGLKVITPTAITEVDSGNADMVPAVVRAVT